MASGSALGCGIGLALAGVAIGVVGGVFALSGSQALLSIGVLVGSFGGLCFVIGFVLFIAGFFMNRRPDPPPQRPIADIRRQQFMAHPPTGPFTQHDPTRPVFHVATVITKGISWDDLAFLRVGAPVRAGIITDTPAGPVLPIVDNGTSRVIGYATDEHAQAAIAAIKARGHVASSRWSGRILHVERPDASLKLVGGVLVQLWHDNALDRYFLHGRVDV